MLLFVTKLFLKYNIDNALIALYNIIFIISGLINSYYLPDYYGRLLDIFNKDIGLFMTAILYILILNGIVYALMEFEDYYLTIQKNKIEELSNKIIMEKIKEKFLKNPEEVVIGEKIATLNRFKEILGLWYHYSIAYIIPYALTIIAFMVYLYKFDIILPLLMILFLLTSFMLLSTNIKLCGKTCEVSANAYLQKYQSVEDYLSNLLTIHTYNEFKTEDKKLNEAIAKLEKKTKKTITDDVDFDDDQYETNVEADEAEELRMNADEDYDNGDPFGDEREDDEY
jgi:ABC-type multidrug transport system fused ATPase/permease subunit